MQFINFLRTATMRLGLSGSKVAIKSFVFSIGLVAEKQQFYATRLSDFHELSRGCKPMGTIMALLAIPAIFRVPPLFCPRKPLSEPYLGLISGGVTPTPLHPRYTLNTP